MSDDFNAALDELPVFPLHGVVLFPTTLLPLHVFEPRYRALVRDVLARHRTLSVAHVTDPDADMTGNPAIAAVAGVGTIVEHTDLPGGRYNIVLLGRGRVRLEELRFVAPYRRARATLVEDGQDQEVTAGELTALHAAAAAFVQLVRERDASFSMHKRKTSTHGQIADAYAHQLVVSAVERQRVLEAVAVRERVQLVTDILTVQRATLSPPTRRDLN
jgi:ATP-dependent Lon protease